MRKESRNGMKVFLVIIALALIFGVWFFLNQKLIFGDDWITPTYDNPDWRTNEGDLHTFGAWDIESHIWKTEYIVENFPDFQWNPYWYMGMPMYKYYQSGFYFLNIAVKFITGLSYAKSALILIVFAHLLATILTFLVCYKVSKKAIVSALLSIFLLSLSFITLRSYGWEPITVVFLFLYPLGLYFFLNNPKKPLRLSLILIMAISYLSHPLIFFSLSMTFGLYLFALAIREKEIGIGKEHEPYIMKYFMLVFLALLISAVQFFPQLSYEQVTSGAHMGVSYIPFYHVQYNVIPIWQFLFDASNLKGPGFIIWVALFIFSMLFYTERKLKKKNISRFEKLKKSEKTLFSNDIVRGFTLVLLFMVLFYYLEFFNIFPMNLLRSIQYHRIIPEFVMASAVLIAGMSNLTNTTGKKIFYYSAIIGFVVASLFILYNVQTKWQTTNDISGSPEFLTKDFEGRITFPYTDQSLAVRNSFTEIPQVYGYYEQGITNSYADELFSVSSGFHNLETSLVYLKAANVARIYVNTEEGKRDMKVQEMFNESFEFNYNEGERYGYFEIPLANPSMVQAVEKEKVDRVQEYQPKNRKLYQDSYEGSNREEFVSSDTEEIRYLERYVGLLDEDYASGAEIEMINPELYRISVFDAKEETEVIVKMSYDKDFEARIEGEKIEIERIGPDFMLLKPNTGGDYVVELEYKTSKVIIIGGIVSLVSLLGVFAYFGFRRKEESSLFKLKRGEME